jgi:redox-sensitive bicupin YhaK (pirin superfamily)
MSPSDLGEILKPFVFLDLAGFDGRFAPMPMGFGWHPYSGIATVTVMLEEAVRTRRRPASKVCCRPEASSGCEPETVSGIPALPRRAA